MDIIKASSFSENQQLKQKTQKSFHVLAVDDSNNERKILVKLLTISSYQVTAVESGNKALEYLGLLDTDENSCEQKGGMRVNLIMTDYSMPGMSGYDLLKRLKGSSWRDVPVILMSSENIPSRIHMCMEEGAEEFLLKPVRLSDLTKLQDYVTKSVCVKHNLRDESNGKFGENLEKMVVERRLLVDTIANSCD